MRRNTWFPGAGELQKYICFWLTQIKADPVVEVGDTKKKKDEKRKLFPFTISGKETSEKIV